VPRFLRYAPALWFFAVTGLGWAGALTQSLPEAQGDKPEVVEADAARLLGLANEARAADGAQALKWDSALAAAAQKHCLRMAAEGPIAHHYDGEAELPERAGQAGAHFSQVAENIAAGASPTDPLEFHDGWMHSPGHRANLLNREMDSVGIAVVVSHGVTYAVADYARAVHALTQGEVESAFAKLLEGKGLAVRKDRKEARAYCAQPKSGGADPDDPPGYRVYWQSPDASQLPQMVLDQLAAGVYRQAAVGSCAPQGIDGSFTIYRVAVLLYGTVEVRPKRWF